MKTLADLLEHTHTLKWAGSKNELDAYANAKSAMTILGPALPIKSLCPAHAQKVTQVLRKQGLSNGTINRRLSALSSMVGVAAVAGILPQRFEIPRLKEAEPRSRVVTDTELTKVCELMEEHGEPLLAFLVVFLIDTGLRVSEALNLKWSNVDTKSVLVKDTKTRSVRTVPLTPRLRGSLCAMARNHSGPFARVTQRRFSYLWEKCREIMGLLDDPEFVPYSLRHTYASRLSSRGANLVAIQRLLGHTNIKTTMRYVHLNQKDLQAAVALLD